MVTPKKPIEVSYINLRTGRMRRWWSREAARKELNEVSESRFKDYINLLLVWCPDFAREYRTNCRRLNQYQMHYLRVLSSWFDAGLTEAQVIDLLQAEEMPEYDEGNDASTPKSKQAAA